MVWSTIKLLVLAADDHANEDSIDALQSAEEDLSRPDTELTGPQQPLTEGSPAAESIAQDAGEGDADTSAVHAKPQLQGSLGRQQQRVRPPRRVQRAHLRLLMEWERKHRQHLGRKHAQA